MLPAIRVENLGKRYVLGKRRRGSYSTLRETISSAAISAWERLRGQMDGEGTGRGSERLLWALKDVSFEVPPGKVVGMIGRNGAGKSTLLKVLSRITEPTEGRVELRGRVGSLLEVGTGFHPELTGRENIYLSGAILGMRHREMRRKFDAITAFADIDDFLDTPVKRYSSGMYVRLAFAVAAHLEPEILIVDEVLAVGDAQFQKKCLGKMQEVSRGGRTVFFVSHNMDAIQRMCNHVLLMENGRLIAQGGRDEMIARYLEGDGDAARPGETIDLSTATRRGTQKARFVSVAFSSNNPGTANQAYPDGPLSFTLNIDSDAPRTLESLAVSLWSRTGTLLVNADTVEQGRAIELVAGCNQIRVRIERLHLKPDTYTLGLFMSSFRRIHDFIESATHVDVVDLPAENLGRRPPRDGCVTCSFTVEPVGTATA